MCGIAGIFQYAGEWAPVRADALEQMRDMMAHRGPDGAGTWVSEDGDVGLAHRRLAIIDLSEAAHQPMSNEDGSCWLVFNGEIYNHAKLRVELESRGHRFRTHHSDTEVILHAFEEWGIDCVHRFRGMFAFALWDARERALWLVRDRIGIKPLYYTIQGGRVLFGSEIKAILADSRIARTMNQEAFYHYLSFLTTPAPDTLFDGIQKLPGGCFARIDSRGSVRIQRYWDVFDQVRSLEGYSEEDMSEMVLAELRTAVELRKISDVPVGVFLSGGVDSSTNAVLFSEGDSEPVRTFSIGYEGEYQSYTNEFQYARQVAEMIGADHYERSLTQADVIDAMPLVVHHQDEPISDPVCVPVYYVSKLARDNGVVVCQVGEGADELFCGYPTWQRALRLQRLGDLPVPRPVKRLGLHAAQRRGWGHSSQYEWLRRNVEGQPVFWGGAESLHQSLKQELLSPELKRRFQGYTSWDALRPIRARFEERAPDTGDHLQWMSYLDLNFRLPELLLMRVDKMSMAVSLECRVPFLDHEFVGLAMSIPSSSKTRGGESKHILKRAVRGLIPDELIDRRKQGFGVPVYDWVFGELGQTIHKEVMDFANQTGLFDRERLNDFLTQRPTANVWTLYNLALWWRSYCA